MKRLIYGLSAAIGMLLLILDARTALSGAVDAVELCIRSVIPSLFPFFVLSGIMTGALSGVHIPFLRPIGHLCGIPEGAENLLLTGLLGGYPAGAQAVGDCWRQGHLTADDARRMIGFCSNAGPSFIFGMVAGRFEDAKTAWALWAVQLLSCLITGIVLPGKSDGKGSAVAKNKINLSKVLSGSLQAIAAVCGWVILFRVILSVLHRWILWLLPLELQAVFAGALELTNGCFLLPQIDDEALRFITASGMLSFGGLCVAMQTASVTGSLGFGAYIPGKCIQAVTAVALAAMVSPILFGSKLNWLLLLVCVLFMSFSAVILGKIKNNSSNPRLLGV